MLYFILRPLTRIALKAYFRRITINGLENLPKDKAVLLCSNHPTGFIEPCLMACFLPRTLHFLVRGDFFEKPVLSKILIWTNQIPIYRLRDGYERLRKNRNVMNLSYDKLAEGKAILIFPEASTLESKHLRPIKKGAARMALETLNLHPDLDLSIVPIGVNYSSPNRWRSYVNINIGAPIIPELPAEISEMPRAILKLTKTIDEELSKQLLVLNDDVAKEDLDLLLDIGQWDNSPKTSIITQHEKLERFTFERALSENLKGKIDLEKIKEAGPKFHKFTTKSVTGIEMIWALLIFLPVVVFLALNALPILIGVWIRNKYVTVNEFIGAIAIAASIGAYMILFIVTFIISLILCGWWAFLLFLLPPLGLLGLWGLDYLIKIWDRFRFRGKLGRERQAQLFAEGRKIIERYSS